jgi:hypothetical protein
MRPLFTALGRTAAIMLGSTLAVVASAQQQPNKLDPGSTPAYQEHNTTSPASAAAAWDQARKTNPGKTSAGKAPPPDRPNGLGMDAGAGSMGKKQ